jgi:predicted nucleic-acid-binding Zn-ribbon protein
MKQNNHATPHETVVGISEESRFARPLFPSGVRVLDAACPKCGSSQQVPDVPVVASVDRFTSTPVSALVYANPDAQLLKGLRAHRILARICGNCGFAELYVEDPKGLLATSQGSEADR